MKKITGLVLILLCLVLPVQAQQKAVAEVTDAMNRAYALVQENKNAEALELFRYVGQQTAARRDSLERQVHVLSQIGAVRCIYELDRFEEAYALADSLMEGRLTGQERQLLAPAYVNSGYMVLRSLLHFKKESPTRRCRAMIDKLRVYANDEFQKRLTWLEALSHHIDGELLHLEFDLGRSLESYRRSYALFESVGARKQMLETLIKMSEAYSLMESFTEMKRVLQKAQVMAEAYGQTKEKLKVMYLLFDVEKHIGTKQEQNRLIKELEMLARQSSEAKDKFDYCLWMGDQMAAWRQYDMAELYYMKGKSYIAALKDQASGLKIYRTKLSSLYRARGQYDKALEIARLNLQDGKKNPYEVSGLGIFKYLEIAELCSKIGDRRGFETALDTAMVISTQTGQDLMKGLTHMYYGLCLADFKDYGQALVHYAQADSILATQYDEHFDLRKSIGALMAGALVHKGDYLESEAKYRQMTALYLEEYGAQSLIYAEYLIHQANAEAFAGHLEEGYRDYVKAVHIYKHNIRERHSFMSSSEREGFWTKLSPRFTEMTAFAVEAGQTQTPFTESCYDIHVLNKAFLLETERSIYEVLKESNDTSALYDFSVLSALKAKVRNWEKDYQTYSDSITALVPEINRLDRQLTEKSQVYGDITSFMDIDYRKVREALGKREILIDFADFMSRSRGRRYTAYVIDAKQKHPLLLDLFEERQIDSLGIVRPDMYYDPDYAQEVIRLLWLPLSSQVREGDTVYYVPSQLLFQISLESLPLADGTLLGEHYHFVRLSSARELLKKEKTVRLSAAHQSAVLYGGLQYDIDTQSMAQQAAHYDLSRMMVMRGETMRGDSSFVSLPGSKDEVEAIDGILRDRQYQVKTLLGKDGSEESFLSLHGQSPQILHLATHGFYYTPERAQHIAYLRGSSDAMSLSGLVLSGGNAAWSGQELPQGVLGGILTAYQIARLDLRGTEMVVLSACQSGQGTATAEGLYGLQRAFKKAGAGTLIMALWSISDQKATEFMIQFYRCLADKKNHWDKHAAFRQARSLFRAENPDPYYWAAFVMLD